MKQTTITLLSSLMLMSLLGCGGGGNSSRGEQVVAILKTGFPEAEAREEVRKFEESLAKKSPQYDRDRAWTGYLAEAERRVAKAKADNEARRAQEAAEAARWDGAEERWTKWIASKKASGHLLDHLLAMRNLGREGTERATGGKFTPTPGYGDRLTLVTDKGIRIDAAYYGAKKLRNPKTGKWDLEAKFTPLTGFQVSMADGQKLDKGSVLKLLDLPASEFKALNVRWADYAFNWKKLKAPIGSGADIGAHPNGPLVFWTGP
jgi:hypothetical protein